MSVPRREANLKQSLVEALRQHLRGAVVIRHEDRFTSGIPDVSVTLLGLTSWWECKHACPSIDSRGIQELTALRLAVAGYCRYLVWEEKKDVKRTMILHPNQLAGMVPEAFCAGFDHRWVVEYVRRVHKA